MIDPIIARTATLPFYDAQAIHRALDFGGLIEALRIAFARGGTTAPVRHVHTIDAARGDRLLLMPAWRAGEAVGVKIVTVYPQNPLQGVATVGATYVLLDGATGHPRAVFDGEAITLRRTGAASALAATYLARPDAAVLTIVGAGHLARYLAAAHCAVRPITRVLVWARHAERAEVLAQRLRDDGIAAAFVPRLADAVSAADIVSAATTSAEPLIQSAWVRPGTHIDLVGGFTRQMREADDALMARATLVVDTYDGALTEAGDLTQPIERGVITPDRVVAELASLARGEHPGRRSADEVTLFKSVGAALEDLVAAELVLAAPASLIR